MGTQEFGSLRNSLRAMKLECGRPVSPQGKGRSYPGGRGQGGPLSGAEWGTGVSLSLTPLDLQGGLLVIPIGPLQEGLEMPGGDRDSPVSSCFPSFPLRILWLVTSGCQGSREGSNKTYIPDQCMIASLSVNTAYELGSVPIHMLLNT